MRTIGRRWPEAQGPDRQSLCSYCGVQWRRSQLTRDASANLACPDCAPGLDIVSLTEGNARLMRSRQPKTVGPSDGNFDRFTSPPDPGFDNPNGPPVSQYVPRILPYVANTLTFPATVVPSIWLDSNQTAYANSAGTIPNSFGFIRRINEPAPLAGTWTPGSDAERPYRDGNSLRFDPQGSVGGYDLFRNPGGGIVGNACTIVVSFVARDSSFAGQPMGLLYESSATVGLRGGGADMNIFYQGGGQWNPTAKMRAGQRNTLVIRYTAGGVDVKIDAGGSVSTDALVTPLAATAANGLWVIGAYGANFLYGAMMQAFAVPRAVTDAERDALIAWCVGQNSPAAYPDFANLVAFCGDSITRGTPGTAYYQTYSFSMLPFLRMNKNVELANCAVGGAGVASLLTSQTFMNATSQYSATRVSNVLVIAIGCNDLANGNPVEFVLYGTGLVGYPGSGIYPACDAARAQGWKVVLLTIGPRSDAMAVSQTLYNARRAQVNASILTEGWSHADAVVDTTQIVNYGRDGDSNNPNTYLVDKIHPIAAGHALLMPYVRDAIIPFLV